MPALTVELLNPTARTILDGLEDAGLIAVCPITEVRQIVALREDHTGDFWHQKSVDELAEEQGVRPINNLDSLFGYGKDLWETEREWNDYMESVQAVRREGT